MRALWTEQIEAGEGGVIDVLPWMSRLTLDVIGSAALGEEMRTLDRSDHVLAREFAGLVRRRPKCPSLRVTGRQTTAPLAPSAADPLH